MAHLRRILVIFSLSHWWNGSSICPCGTSLLCHLGRLLLFPVSDETRAFTCELFAVIKCFTILWIRARWAVSVRAGKLLWPPGGSAEVELTAEMQDQFQQECWTKTHLFNLSFHILGMAVDSILSLINRRKPGDSSQLIMIVISHS